MDGPVNQSSDRSCGKDSDRFRIIAVECKDEFRGDTGNRKASNSADSCDTIAIIIRRESTGGSLWKTKDDSRAFLEISPAFINFARLRNSKTRRRDGTFARIACRRRSSALKSFFHFKELRSGESMESSRLSVIDRRYSLALITII